jgi:uncharacterized protein DUF6364
MNTKLTLTVDRNIIKKAKVYAKSEGRSLSNIIENYLKTITRETNNNPTTELTPIVKSLKGSFKMPEGYDYKKELLSELSKKYLDE